MCLIKDASGVLAIRGQVVCDDTVDLVVSANLEGLVQDVVDSLSDLLVRDDVNVVKDADGLTELLHLNGVSVESLAQLDPLGSNLVK